MIKLKAFLHKHRNSVVRAWLKHLGFPHHRYTSEFLEGTYLEPSEAYFSPYSKVFHYGRSVLTTHPLATLRGYFSKDSLAIVGSGPSLKEMDLSRLAAMDVILLNGAISLIDSHKVRPSLVAIIDATFCTKRFKLLEALPKGTPLLLSFSALKQLLLLQESYLKDYPVYLVHFHPLTEKRYQQPDFALDELDQLQRGFLDGGTVLATALQCAIAHNLSHHIYLLGFDIGNAMQPRFNESRRSRLRSGLLDDYEQKILPSMQALSSHASNKGISVYNCSKITKLPYSVIPYSPHFEKAGR